MCRRILAAAAALCLLLGGCSNPKAEVSNLRFQFDCKADVQYPGGSVTCSFQRMGQENAELEILSGGSQGLSWVWSGDGFTVLYQGLAASGESCVLPKDSFAAVLVHTLDQAEKAGSLTPAHGNEFSGNAGYDYTLTADPETGQIQTMNVPECGVKVKFYDYAQQTIGTNPDADALPD